MRIVHVISYFQPKLGYQEYYLAKEQQKLGHEVYIITSDRYYPFHNQPFNFKQRIIGSGARIEQGIRVYRLPTIFEIGTYCIAKGLKKVLNALSPDIVHAHEIHTITPSLPAFFKNHLKYRYLIDTHVYMPFHPVSARSRGNLILFKFIKKALFQYAVREADAIVAVDYNHRKWFSDEFNIPVNNIHVIPLGADHQLFTPDPKVRSESRSKLGIKESDVVIVYAGKIIPSKDIHTLFHAYAKVVKTRKNVKLLVIGWGDPAYTNMLHKLSRKLDLSNHIIFHAPVTNTELPRLYNTADVGVWPGSRSITIIEAMATGLPIIVSRNDPSDDYPYAHNAKRYLEYENGLSFTRGNTNELALCIQYLVDNEETRLEMGRRSRKLVEDKLNWSIITQKFMALYESIT